MLHLSPEEMIARARGDLRIGAPVAVEVSDASAVVVAAETATQDRLDALWKIAADGLDIAVTRRRAAVVGMDGRDRTLTLQYRSVHPVRHSRFVAACSGICL